MADDATGTGTGTGTAAARLPGVDLGGALQWALGTRRDDEEEEPNSSATAMAAAEELTPEAAVEKWKAVGFSSIKLALDEQAEVVVETRKEDLDKRKHVASVTREFRAGKVGVDAVIKAYQEHVDDLSKHAKFNGDAFVTMYRILAELPDPSTPLAHLQQRLAETEGRLRTVEERALAIAERSRDKAKAAESLRAERDRWKEDVTLAGEAKVGQALVSVEERLLKAREQFDAEQTRMQAQLDAALGEVERLQAELADARAAAAAASSTASARDATVNGIGTGNDDAKVHYTLDDVERARAEGEQRMEEAWARRMEDSAKQSRDAMAAFEEQVEDLRAQCAAHLETISNLRTEMQRAPSVKDVERLKSQLAVMRRLAKQPTLEEEEDASEDNLDSLESWLLSANQRLTEDLERVKREFEEEKAKWAKEDAAAVVVPAPPPTPSSSPPAASAAAAAAATDDSARLRKLRAAVERRDVQIEELQRALEERNLKLQRAEEESDKLKQRVRFLQSYKASERSTLVPALSPGGGGETQALGRGVEHQFRALWESDLPGAAPTSSSSSSGPLPDRVATRVVQYLFVRSRGRAFLFWYACAVHVAVAALLLRVVTG